MNNDRKAKIPELLAKARTCRGAERDLEEQAPTIIAELLAEVEEQAEDLRRLGCNQHSKTRAEEVATQAIQERDLAIKQRDAWRKAAELALEYTEGNLCWRDGCTRESCHEMRALIKAARELMGESSD